MAAGSSWQGPRSWLRNRMDNSCRAGNNKCPKKIATIQMVMEPAEPLASKPMDGTKKKNTKDGTLIREHATQQNSRHPQTQMEKRDLLS